MNNINEQLETINGILDRIDAKQKAINDKLDEVIKALHEYDDNDYGESSFEAFMDAKGGPCSKHDEASWDEIETNKRMDIIGQNGNEGIHYVTNEEADDDARSNNNSANTRVDKNNVGRKTGGDKKKYKGKRKFTQDLIPKNK